MLDSPAMSRRRIEDASPFYDELRKDLPEALHATFIHEQDVQDATAWLEDGVPPPPRRHTPETGMRIETPERYLMRAFGRNRDATRWVLFSKWRFTEDEIPEMCEGWRGFNGFELRGYQSRMCLNATGRGNARRYYGYCEHLNGRHSQEVGPIRLYRYETPAPAVSS